MNVRYVTLQVLFQFKKICHSVDILDPPQCVHPISVTVRSSCEC